MKPIEPDGIPEHRAEYNFYIDTVIQFQKLFSYNGSIQSILELPYPLLQDLMIAKIKDQQAEKDKIDKLKGKNSDTVTYGINDKL